MSYGCATKVALAPSALTPGDSVAFGRVNVQLTGPVSRIYAPELRFFEVVNRDNDERFRVDVNAAEAALALKLPPGDYELTRIMINEGAFQAMATPGPTFRVDPGRLNYLGAWRFDISSPTYGRKIELVITSELDEATQSIRAQYPNLSEVPVVSQLAAPARSGTRLYEVTPYPRIWWFRRHHTT